MPLIEGLRVVRSGVHGYGVVATRNVRTGATLSEVEGVVRHTDEDYDDTYSLYIDGTHLFDMVDQNRYINHSCSPNCEVEVDIDAKGNGAASIVAIRNIRVGEELAYDYAFPADLAEKCYCQAPNCRGWIVDQDEMGQLQRRLAREAKQSATDRPAAGYTKATTKKLKATKTKTSPRRGKASKNANQVATAGKRATKSLKPAKAVAGKSTEKSAKRGPSKSGANKSASNKSGANKSGANKSGANTSGANKSAWNKSGASRDSASKNGVARLAAAATQPLPRTARHA